MTLTPSLPTLEATGLPAAARRRIQAGMVARAADGTPRTGVLPEHFNALVTGKASMGYDVQPFVAVTSRQSPGVEFVANDGVVDISPAGYAAPLANSRLDVIWVRSRFTIFGDSVNTTEIGLTQGTAATTPILPVIPAGALAIGVAEVKATDTTTATVVIQPPQKYTAMAGGVVSVRTQAELDAWTPADGARAYRIDKKAGYRRGNGAWIPDRAVFFANRGSAQSLSPAGWWVVASAFAAPSLNDIGTWSGTNGTLQVQHAGIYRVGGFVKLAIPSNPMSIQITRNSGAPDVGVVVESFVNSATSSLNASALVSLSAGDVIRLLVFNSDATTVAAAQLSLELVTLT